MTAHLKITFCICASLFATASSLRADLVVVDFDALTATSSGTLYAGNTFAASGVNFTSGSIPNALSVGSVFTLGGVNSQTQR